MPTARTPDIACAIDQCGGRAHGAYTVIGRKNVRGIGAREAKRTQKEKYMIPQGQKPDSGEPKKKRAVNKSGAPLHADMAMTITPPKTASVCPSDPVRRVRYRWPCTVESIALLMFFPSIVPTVLALP